ncbi:MAG TPA: peptidase M50 [Mycobacterium sp.]|nr:peptidase M50 [Mycobacterium sp.]
MTSTDVVVLVFGGRTLPRPLRGIPVQRVGGSRDIDELASQYRRLVVVGSDADLAAVLTRLLRSEKLDVEVGFVAKHRSAATRAHRLPTGWRAARLAASGQAHRVPLIRDDTGAAIVGSATWRGADGPLHGEAVVDDTTLFDGQVFGVRVQPIGEPPGLRAAVLTQGDRRRRWVVGRWVVGRAAQLGSTGALVERDGVAAKRPVPRSTFYRHIQGWLLVR